MTKLFTLVFSTRSFLSLSAFSSKLDKSPSLETSKTLKIPLNTYIAGKIRRYDWNNATRRIIRITAEYTKRNTTLDITELTKVWFGNDILLNFKHRVRPTNAL